MNETKPIYLGEMRLLRWGHSDSSGRTVTFELPTDEPRHPFEGYSTGREYGQRMKVVCVALDDHEQPLGADEARNRQRPAKKNGPVAQSDRAPVRRDVQEGEGSSPSGSTTARTYTRSQRAAIMCQDIQFRVWFCDQLPKCFSIDGEDDAANCDKALKAFLGIASKKELDTNPEAAARFDALRTDYELKDMVR